MSKLSRRKFISYSSMAVGLMPLANLEHLINGDQKGPENPFNLDGNQQVFFPPEDPKEWAAYRQALHEWRKTVKKKLNYDDSLYKRPDFQWVSKTFCCCFLMMNDETFYSSSKGEYLVDSFLEMGKKEFGGYDSIVLWHAYPRIGVDERNQFEIYEGMPGGLSGLRDLSNRLHEKQVKVFIDYNPWDKGTKRPDKDDLSMIAGLVKAIDADGVFLDTMSTGGEDLRRKVDAARPGVVFEGEGALPLENIYNHHMSWAQYFPASAGGPGVLRDKWLERQHMQHQIKRWERDHTSELHSAWMNGSGMMVWENVFGSWVGWNRRDKSILRSMLPIQRRYNSLFSGEGWEPFIITEMPDVYCTLWQEDGLQLYTLINKSEKTKEGVLLEIPLLKGGVYHDLISGARINPVINVNKVILKGNIKPRGIAAILVETQLDKSNDFNQFLTRQASLFKQMNFNTNFPQSKTNLISVKPTRRFSKGALPKGMISIPGVTMELHSSFFVRECGLYESASQISMQGSQHKSIGIGHKVVLSPYAMDETPVTNAQFALFLKGSGYRPKEPTNFLKHWNHGLSPIEKGDHPVVNIDINDARAYAKWAGKRLPTEMEWQYAAQGPDVFPLVVERIYPWGNELKEGYCNMGQTAGTTPVKAFPKGRSAFGIYDLCGNVWQFTESERSDGRTRFVIIRGGSYYHPNKEGYNIGYVWYVEHGPQPANHSVKLLTMWPGLDRCSTIGFRCVADME